MQTLIGALVAARQAEAAADSEVQRLQTLLAEAETRGREAAFRYGDAELEIARRLATVDGADVHHGAASIGVDWSGDAPRITLYLADGGERVVWPVSEVAP